MANALSVEVGPDGLVYVSDTKNDRIRRVAPDSTITTFAGSGIADFGGDGGPATDARLKNPAGIAVNPDSSIYISDAGNHRIRRVGSDGIITTVAGVGTEDFSGDGGPATESELATPVGVAVGPDGAVYIADKGNNRIRRVGILTEEPNKPPVVGHSISGQELEAEGTPFSRDLNSDPSVFSDVDADTLIYRVRTSDAQIATASISGSMLTITAVSEGSATITLTADDGIGGTVSTTFTVTVTPSKPPPVSGPCPDFDGNKTVDFNDFVAFVKVFGTTDGDGRYDAKFDLITDGTINFTDFIEFIKVFGQTVEC